MCQKKTGDRRYNQKSPVSVGDVVKVLVLDVDEKKRGFLFLSGRQNKIENSLSGHKKYERISCFHVKTLVIPTAFSSRRQSQGRNITEALILDFRGPLPEVKE